jgi:hypothetical protein
MLVSGPNWQPVSRHILYHLGNCGNPAFRFNPVMISIYAQNIVSVGSGEISFAILSLLRFTASTG